MAVPSYKNISNGLWLGQPKKNNNSKTEASWLFPLSCPSMSTMMHGVFSRAHLCTVQSVARQCPYPAYKLWSSAGTGRHRSPHQNHTPAPPWQMMREIDITRISPQMTKIMTKKMFCLNTGLQTFLYQNTNLGLVFLITIRWRALTMGLAIHLNTRSSKTTD